MKLKTWNEAETSTQVMKFFANATDARKVWEYQWQVNEATAFGPTNSLGNAATADQVIDNVLMAGAAAPDQGQPNINVAYTFKNLRFIHSQLSANPPTVAMRPTSSDQEDVRRADAADRVGRYAIRQYKMQERVDRLTLGTLTYGTGVLKTVWDSGLGDMIEFNQEDGEITMEGDISITTPHTWNIYIDPDARTPDDVKRVVERIYMDYDLACAKWPEKKEILEQARMQRDGSGPYTSNDSTQSIIREEHYNVVELLEYWETGLPTNGFMGRYCIVTAGGGVIESCRPSPFRFPAAGSIARVVNDMTLPDSVKDERLKKLPQMAQLPYHILTDIDIPNCVYGKSALEYAAALQEVLSQIDSAHVDNMRAHGSAKLVVPDTAEINDDYSNSTWDIVKTSQAPYHVKPPEMMPEMVASRNNMITGINDVMGVNESMFGQQSREQSGASMQYATNQGNMIRRRLFNKYVLVVESIYKAILNLVRKHWTVERTIRVIGKEKAFESLSLKGADIDGGYDVVGEYGVTLSLDPITRREEIMTLQPLFEKAGIPARMSMKMMKLNELEGMFDKLQMAEDRQKEYFDEMVARQLFVEPEPMEDHTNMIAWAMDYFMTAEFKYLEREAKDLCREHIRARIQLAASEASGGITQQPQSAALPQPGTAPAAAMGTAPPIEAAPAGPQIVNG